MFTILNKQVLALNVKRLDVKAPKIALSSLPGQFVLVCPKEASRSIPLSIVDVDTRKGSVTLIIHEIGSTSRTLGDMAIGEAIFSMVGPLGQPLPVGFHGVVITVATGFGAAQMLPVCRALKKNGNRVIGIMGAKAKNELMLEAQMRVVCDELFIATNDGSYERKGLASLLLAELLSKMNVQAVYAVGSLEMMQAATQLAAQYHIPIWLTLNTMMGCATGLCGSCRMKVGDAMKWMCLEGPHVDGAEVDFAYLSRREALLKELKWGKPNFPQLPKSDGFPIFMKSVLGLIKKKT